MNALFAEVGDQIDLVILSDRFGSKHGGPLRQLVRGIRQRGLRMTAWLGFDIVAVQGAWRVAQLMRWMSRRAPALETVRDLSARYRAIVLETADVNSQQSVELVRRLGIDIVIVMNFDQILKNAFIEAARLAVINIHPSLLPAFRGPCPVFWAMIEGCREVGVTIHLIENNEIDAGPILLQRAMDLDVSQSVGEVTSALFMAAVASIKSVTDCLAKDGYNCTCERAAVGDYKGFPTRKQMAIAARRVRLCRFAHWSLLLRLAINFPFQRADEACRSLRRSGKLD